MPWRGPEYPGEFPTLGYQVAELIEAECAIPDGELVGEPYLLTDEMLRFLLWYYRIDPVTGRFTFERGGQLCRPQKWGKGPFSAAIICAEAHPEGPVRPAGWNAQGEPVGRPWPTPWIQVTAFSDAQTDNVWRALVPMIEKGTIGADIPDTGMTRINLPSGGLIEPVTSSAGSRLGQRITKAVQDQSESYTAQNGMRRVVDVQRRNLAGTGGRFLETPNAWDPGEDTVAQYTAEHEPGVYVDDVDPGPGSIRNKRDRRRMLKKVYGDSWWVSLDRIDAEIEALLPRDPAQAERAFLNRKNAAEGLAFDAERWKKLADAGVVVPDRSLVTIGVNGARFEDALVIVGTDVSQGHQFVIGTWERPEAAEEDYEHPSREIDGAMQEAFDRFEVWRCYANPQWIDHLLSRWQGRWGERKVIPWYTNRPKQMAYAVRTYRTAVQAGDLTHDGDGVLARHIGGARRRPVNVYDEHHRRMWVLQKDRPGSPNSIAGAVAGCLSWEARSDAVAAGQTQRRRGAASF